MDQLIARIKEIDSASKDSDFSGDVMKETAEIFLNANVKNHSDYAKIYEELVQEMKNNEENLDTDLRNETVENEGKAAEEKILDVEAFTQALKKFRLEYSRAEGVKPYYIFNDAQMMDLIAKKPKTKEQLLQVSGFGKVKIEKYGSQILEILNSGE